MSTAVRARKPTKPKPLIGPGHNGIRMTPEEFDAIPESEWDENYYYELVDGVLIVSPPPLDAHMGPNEMLGHWLLTYRDQHPEGAALDATLPERYLRLPRSRRIADRLIWTGLGRTPNTRKDVASIAVEFVSEGRRNWMRDYVEKRDEYLAMGVQEYWVIDRFERALTIYQKSGRSKKEVVVKGHEVYRTPLLPGFELPLAQLLAVADAWAEKE